ncbi:class I SAM-dependent methyltransferase [Paraliomyxa miuraensis]|uniref:hypothetical protein n=1 Tax=Paraliomyxa miuraensis TaxID=376150 RepID=UPI0022566FC8|nr:hypothetical protein [Paraliomyxa miuraensis]MCX4243588.1 hypothetical protein [Paraliomyxa miuraensis]
MSTVDEVVEAVLASRRYRTVFPPLVRRVAGEQGAVDGQRPAQVALVVKRTKRALHQIFGAYLPQPTRPDRILADLRVAESDEQVRAVLERAMHDHASTRERLDYLEPFFDALRQRVGTPRSVLDVACGLNPLAYAWWGLPQGAQVHAWDLDVAMVELLQGSLPRLGLAPHAKAVDLLAIEHWPSTEVALVLKILPTLEQQRPGASEAMLAAIPAPVLVVSFPTRSLGGHAKGMGGTYARQFEALLGSRGWTGEVFEVGTELLYHVVRR